MLRALPLFVLVTVLGACAPDQPADQLPADSAAAPPRVSGPFSSPESALYDAIADVYLVSNINGDGTAHDDNGYITRVRPDGSIEDSKWIDGASPAFTLNAPKGMALRGDTLLVADIDTVRAFQRVTGELLYARAVPGATFLNDIAVGADEAYVTDSGFNGGMGAVYALRDSVVTLARGDSLHAPNGLVATRDMLLMVSYDGAALWRVSLDGQGVQQLSSLPRGGLDGVVQLPSGDLLVSSWEAKAIYRLHADGKVEQLPGEVESPADLGYDARRKVLLIPLLQRNELELRALK